MIERVKLYGVARGDCLGLLVSVVSRCRIETNVAIAVIEARPAWSLTSLGLLHSLGLNTLNL